MLGGFKGKAETLGSGVKAFQADGVLGYNFGVGHAGGMAFDHGLLDQAISFLSVQTTGFHWLRG
jgi:hypothetical protein